MMVGPADCMHDPSALSLIHLHGCRLRVQLQLTINRHCIQQRTCQSMFECVRQSQQAPWWGSCHGKFTCCTCDFSLAPGMQLSGLVLIQLKRLSSTV